MCVRIYIYVCVWDYRFMYVCETTFMKHLKQALNTLWNEEMTKIKVEDFDELYNFYIYHIYNWNHLVVENQVSSVVVLQLF